MPAHKHIFEAYLNPWFIESGFFEGQGVEYAIQAGFKNIKSIEIHQPFWQAGLIKFHNIPQIKELILGSTEEKLWNAIKDINEPITFWLDGHYSNPKDTPTKGKENCPLIKELDIIKRHPLVKQHTILIDDIRCCGTELFDYLSKQDLINKVWDVCSKYSIWFENSWELSDILVAKCV